MGFGISGVKGRFRPWRPGALSLLGVVVLQPDGLGRKELVQESGKWKVGEEVASYVVLDTFWPAESGRVDG